MVNPSEFCVSGNALRELERSRAAGLLGNSPQVLLRNLWTEPIRIDIHSKIHQRWQKKGHRTKMGWNVFFFSHQVLEMAMPRFLTNPIGLGVDRIWKAPWRFEVNIYHCLLLHGFLIFGAPQTKSEMSNFRNRVSYLVGSRRRSLSSFALQTCTRHGSAISAK